MEEKQYSKESIEKSHKVMNGYLGANTIVHQAGPNGRDCSKRNKTYKFTMDINKVTCPFCNSEDSKWKCTECKNSISIEKEICPFCKVKKDFETKADTLSHAFSELSKALADFGRNVANLPEIQFIAKRLKYLNKRMKKRK